MALGTFTQQNLNPVLTAAEPGFATVDPGMKMTAWTFAADSAYSAGGTAISPAAVGLGSEGVILWAVATIVASTGSNNLAIHAAWNQSTGKLQMFASTGTSPVGLAEAGAGNLSGLTIQLTVLGYPSL